MKVRVLILMLALSLGLSPAAMTAPMPAGMRTRVDVAAAPDTFQSFGIAPAAEARKSKEGKKKKAKLRKFGRTVRRPLTRTFTNPARIEVPLDQEQADLYPSAITVSGFANGTILDVDVILNGVNWGGFPQDADILLTATQLPARSAVVHSDVCEGSPIDSVILTLDDEAAEPLPATGDCDSGTFQPTNLATDPGDAFPDAPPTNGSSRLSAFDGGNPNGTWQLFVVDDLPSDDSGKITNGWALRITAEVDVQVEKKVKVKRDKKRKRG